MYLQLPKMNVIPLAILGVKWPFSQGCGSTFNMCHVHWKRAILLHKTAIVQLGKMNTPPLSVYGAKWPFSKGRGR